MKLKKKFKFPRLIKFLELCFDIFLVLFAFQFVHIVYAFLFDPDKLVFINKFVEYLSDRSGDLQDFNSEVFINEFIFLIATNSILLILTLIFFRFYRVSLLEKKYKSAMASTFLALILSNVILFIIQSFFEHEITMTLRESVILVITQMILISSYKFLFSFYVSKRNYKLCMIVGPEKDVDKIAKKFYIDNDQYHILSYLAYEVNGSIDESVFDKIKDCDRVYLTESLSLELKNKLLDYCIGKSKIDIHIVPQLYELGMLNAQLAQVDDLISFDVKSLHMTLEQRFIKRTFDIVCSLIGIIITLPIMIITALLIKLNDGGPVFFKQKRITRDNVSFNIIKFRSMSVPKNGIVVNKKAQENDIRITKIGKIIRALRIDELPQLFNVLSGKISIVGPRALAVYEVEDAANGNHRFYFRHNVKSGITGLAQVFGKYDTEEEDKLRFDLIYIRKQNLIYDLSLILYTIRTIFDRTSTRYLDKSISLEEIFKKSNIDYTKSNNIIEIKYK